MWWRFKKHRLALVGSAILLVMYLAAGFSEFIAPYDMEEFTDVCRPAAARAFCQ